MTKRAAALQEFGKLIRQMRREARAEGRLLSQREIQQEIDAARRERHKQTGKVSARSPRRRS